MSQPYFYQDAQPQLPRPTIIHRLEPFEPKPREITARRLLLHLSLLALTGVTTTALSGLLFFNGTLASLGACLLFSFTLLSILGAHEMGHYIACRYYRVQASLPYFIPAPVGIGTFGAFIKIKSPIPHRRALFDIGISGPLAGFVFALPASVIAHYFAAAAPPVAAGEGGIMFHAPLLFQFFEWLFGLPPEIEANPVWLASWVGLLMTSLNLLPVGQLDGGHVSFSLFGPRGHLWIGRAIYLVVLALAAHALISDGWVGWVVYSVLLTLILRVGHPPLLDEEERLGRGRKLIAAIGLAVFLLSFMPVPVTIIS